jgi:uncharacterized membrane protein YcaP (DUF421 family)
MDAVLHGSAVYLLLLLIFRIAGKRSLAQITTFDFVLLLIIAETTQQALVGNDFSITKAFLLVITLVSIDITLALWKQRWPRLDKFLEDSPLLLVKDGQVLQEQMEQERIDETDVLSAARELQGLERMEQIKYAVLERDGKITIIPKKKD